MMKMSVTTEDKGGKDFKKFLEMLKKYKHASVTAGIHEDAGEYPDNVSVVEVALWNEFGTVNAPERSFFRSAIDQHEGEINSWREEAINKILDGIWTVEQALNAIGLRLQILIQNQIKSNVPPPNSEYTLAIKRKEGAPTQTLIHTWLMYRSVGYKVHLEGKGAGGEE